MPEEMLTVKEAAELLGVHQSALYHATREGRLPFVVVFGRKVVRREDVEAYRLRTAEVGSKGGRPPKVDKPAADAPKRGPGRPPKNNPR